MNAPFTRGELAWAQGVGVDMCPYSRVDDQKSWELWCNGWVSAYFKHQEILTEKMELK